MLRRILVTMALVVVGFAAGFGVVSSLGGPEGAAPPAPTITDGAASSVTTDAAAATNPPPTSLTAAAPIPSTTARSEPSTTSVPSTNAVPSTTSVLSTNAVAPATLLIWTSGGLPATLGPALAAAPDMGASTVVAGDQVDLVAVAAADGTEVLRLEAPWRIAIDALAIDPSTYSGFVAPEHEDAVVSLETGQALLTETSARLRRIGEGGVLELADGTSLEVAGIIGDVAGAGAELLVDRQTGSTMGLTTPRFALARPTQPRADAEAWVRDHLDPPAPLRFRVTGETPYLRHGDAVLPQALIKERFGEFAYRPGSGRSVEVDPEWVAANIETRDVPILGALTCHRDILDLVEAAMNDLQLRALDQLVNPANFAGCYSPRRTAPGQPLSRHSWGIALDLNIGANPRGSFSTQDLRLVAAMEAEGFGWGGEWLFPDPGHYEWLRETR